MGIPLQCVKGGENQKAEKSPHVGMSEKSGVQEGILGGGSVLEGRREGFYSWWWFPDAVISGNRRIRYFG